MDVVTLQLIGAQVSGGLSDLRVAVYGLGPKELAGIRRDPQILSVAPLMPIRLIRPIPVLSGASSDIPDASWGVGAVGADQSRYTGKGVSVAVLDTGIDKNHPAFTGIGISTITKDFTGNGPEDDDGHGTHCAGTIFGRTTDGCRIGVAPGVGNRLIGKVIGRNGGSTDSLFKAMLWAVQEGAHIISLAIDLDFPAYQQNLSQLVPSDMATAMALAGYRENLRLFDLLGRMTRAGIGPRQGPLLIAAAGNESRRELGPEYRVELGPLATTDSCLSVAALGKSDDPLNRYQIAPFSSTGARISGPGVSIWSAKAGGGLACRSGTSMATAHAAGVAALWAEKVMLSGPFRASRLMDEIGRSAFNLKNLDPYDVGLGLVSSPNGSILDFGAESTVIGHVTIGDVASGDVIEVQQRIGKATGEVAGVKIGNLDRPYGRDEDAVEGDEHKHGHRPRQERTTSQLKRPLIWIAERDKPDRPLRLGTEQTLHIRMGNPASSTLVEGGEGDIPVEDIPDDGLVTDWVVCTQDVELRIHPDDPSVKVSVATYNGLDLRLIFPLEDASGIPAEGKNLIVVAPVGEGLLLRIFGADGRVIVDIDETKLPQQARRIKDLRKQLDGLWPPHVLMRGEKARAVAAISSIVADIPYMESNRRVRAIRKQKPQDRFFQVWSARFKLRIPREVESVVRKILVCPINRDRSRLEFLVYLCGEADSVDLNELYRWFHIDLPIASD